MKHASLFTGIGGFDLAAQWAGWENVFQVEIDTWCQRLLKQNFKNAKLYSDIRDFDGTDWRGSVDVLSGGFPCQPFSTAGKRLGTDDERHLWPQMLRVIREVAPRWVVGENVRGLVNWSGGLVFEHVCADLEAAGYEAQPFVLPAASVNAPHERQRVWFVAHSTCDGHKLRGFTKDRRKAEAGERKWDKREWVRGDTWGISKPEVIAHAIGIGHPGRESEAQRKFEINRNAWDQFPTQSPLCGGNDGVPHRVDRIKGLGNAVVPQLVLQIFEAINDYEENCN